MKKSIVIFLFVLLSASLKAQDPTFSQFYMNPMFYNPALAGGTGLRLIATDQLKWPKIPMAVNTSMLSIDVPVNNYSNDLLHGFGLMYINDIEGPLQTNTISGLISFNAGGEKSFLLHGINVSYFTRRIDYNRLIFADQLDPLTGYSSRVSEFTTPEYDVVKLPDVGFGFVYGHFFTKRFGLLGGFALNHLLTSRSTILGIENASHKIPVKTTAHLNTVIKIGNIHGSKRGTKLTPAIIYERQSNRILSETLYETFSIGTNLQYRGYMQQPTFIGLWARKARTYENNIFAGTEFDSFSFTFGFSSFSFGKKNGGSFKVAYTFDYTLNQLSTAQTLGTHEITLVFDLTGYHLGYLFSKDRYTVKKGKVQCPGIGDLWHLSGKVLEKL